MRRAKIFFILLVLAGLAQVATAGNMYKWVDEYGNVTYRDTPPPEGKGTVERKNISGGHGEAGDNGAEDATANFPVVLYTTPTCTSCKAAADYLRSRNVPFEEKNVQDDGKLQQELKAKAGELSVPTILIGEKVMKGYVQSLLAGELDAVGYPKPEPAEGTEAAGSEGSGTEEGATQ